MLQNDEKFMTSVKVSEIEILTRVEIALYQGHQSLLVDDSIKGSLRCLSSQYF